MSVETAADKAIQNAKDDIDAAIRNISIALNPDTWGSEELSNECIGKLAIIYGELHLIKIKLK